MAVAKTGALFKALTFDGYSSRNYGIYITGEAVYNAPERDVEMVTIPGRNGAFALDHERFENIEVTYPAGIFADNEEDFADGISSFRNMLCSRQGYCVLQDEYHPDEYRLAVYKSGLEVTPTQLKAGEFDITFTCKPQRFLTSGDTAVAVANNGTITNPTLFDAKPQLQVWGYGDLNVNGYGITVNNETLGNITLWDDTYQLITASMPYSKSVTFNASQLNTSDNIYVNGKFAYLCKPPSLGSYSWNNFVLSSDSQYVQTGTMASDKALTVKVSLNDFTFTKGTSGTASTDSTATIRDNLNYTLATIVIRCQVSYDGDDTVTWAISIQSITGSEQPGNVRMDAFGMGTGIGNSTKSALGTPTYIDCDIGESYLNSGGEPVSLDHLIELGSKLPVLSPGVNTITYDNTVTSFKIVPRWWRI